MDILESLKQRELAIVAMLRSKQAGVDDRTGKGEATERVVEEELLAPFLPPGFTCGKGSVVSADHPTEQSEAIDRVIGERYAGTPLVYDQSHSIFPIEAVAGLVEITMGLDADKLQTDIGKMVTVKKMRQRRFAVPVPGTKTRMVSIPVDTPSPRAFMVGLPRDPNWRCETIAAALQRVQVGLGPPTLVHGLYVLGRGYFSTVPIETEKERPYRVIWWPGDDRLFRFTTAFRAAFDRWRTLPAGWTADVSQYVPGAPMELPQP